MGEWQPFNEDGCGVVSGQLDRLKDTFDNVSIADRVNPKHELPISPLLLLIANRSIIFVSACVDVERHIKNITLLGALWL